MSNVTSNKKKPKLTSNKTSVKGPVNQKRNRNEKSKKSKSCNSKMDRSERIKTIIKSRMTNLELTKNMMKNPEIKKREMTKSEITKVPSTEQMKISKRTSAEIINDYLPTIHLINRTEFRSNTEESTEKKTRTCPFFTSTKVIHFDRNYLTSYHGLGQTFLVYTSFIIVLLTILGGECFIKTTTQTIVMNKTLNRAEDSFNITTIGTISNGIILMANETILLSNGTILNEIILMFNETISNGANEYGNDTITSTKMTITTATTSKRLRYEECGPKYYFIFVIAIGSIAMVILVMIYAFHIVEAFEHVPWLIIECIFYPIWCMQYFIASILIASNGSIKMIFLALIGTIDSVVLFSLTLVQLNKIRRHEHAQMETHDPDGNDIRAIYPNFRFYKAF